MVDFDPAGLFPDLMVFVADDGRSGLVEWREAHFEDGVSRRRSGYRLKSHSAPPHCG